MEDGLYRALLVAAGGATGTLARFLLITLLQPRGVAALPAGTLAVNTLGCLAIGLLHGLFVQSWPLRADYRAALLIGVLGGFTTFSAVAWETFALSGNGFAGRAAGYLLLTNTLGIGAVWLGYRLGVRG